MTRKRLPTPDRVRKPRKARVKMAHLRALATQNQEQDRFHWKKTLIRALYKRNYGKQEIFNLFRFLDWVMKLPDTLEVQIQSMIEEYEEANQMQYVTSFERMALDRGHKEGHKEGRTLALRETAIDLIDHRFHLTENEKNALSLQLQQTEEESILKQIINLTMDVETLAVFMAKLQSLLALPLQVDSAASSQK